MGICLEKTTLTSSKIHYKQNINLIKARKNNESDINLNTNKYLTKSNKNNNGIEIDDKYMDKSTILNVKAKELDEKKIFEKTEENNIISMKSKIFVKSQYILKKILLNLNEKGNYF